MISVHMFMFHILFTSYFNMPNFVYMSVLPDFHSVTCLCSLLELSCHCGELHVQH